MKQDAALPRARHPVDYFFEKKVTNIQAQNIKMKVSRRLEQVLTTLIIITQIIEGKQQLVLPYLFLKKAWRVIHENHNIRPRF